MLEKKNWDAALEAGERWIDVAPFDGRSHQLVAQAYLGKKDEAGARKAWELWARVRPNDARDVWITAIESARDAGMPKFAQSLTENARKAGASRRSIRRALGQE